MVVTRVVLVRHGESWHKIEGVVGGLRGDRGLTEVGWRQVGDLAERLGRDFGGDVAAVYSSVLPRAVETARVVAEGLGGLEIVEERGLSTWLTPDEADGLTWDAYRESHGLAGGGVYRPFERGNESWAEMVARAGAVLEEIAARHVGQTVVAVTHAEVVKISLIVFGGLPISLGFDVDIAPASMTVWSTEGDPEAWPRPRWRLEGLNVGSRYE